MIAAALLTGLLLGGGVALAFRGLHASAPKPAPVPPPLANVLTFGQPLIDYASKSYLQRRWWKR